MRRFLQVVYFFSATIFLNDRSGPCRIYFHYTRLCEPFFLFFYKKSPFFIMVYIRKQKERRMLHAAFCALFMSRFAETVKERGPMG